MVDSWMERRWSRSASAVASVPSEATRERRLLEYVPVVFDLLESHEQPRARAAQASSIA